MASAAPKRSLLGLLGSSRAAKGLGGAVRCTRCRAALEGDGGCLRCRCGLSLHRSCAYPPLPEALGPIPSWTCDACWHQQNLEAGETKHDEFCCVCGESRHEELVPCSSCRGSFHADCSETFCPSCRKAREQESPVRLEQWSLELVGQEGLDLVPAVRGLRLDSRGPAGALWRTSEIVHALDSRTLVTRMGQVIVLFGPLCRRLAEKLKLPRQLIQSFKAGFPPNWQLHIRYALRGKDPKALADKAPTRPERQAPQRRAVPSKEASKEAWSDAQRLALQQVLREVRPSEANYWQVVAGKLGRTSEECRREAFGEAPEAVPQRSRKAKRNEQKENEAPNADDEPAMRALPVKDGPRQVKRVRALLNATSFGANRDFLDFRPGDEASHEGAPSPSSVAFLGSLHTGCTPPEPQRRPLIESPKGTRRCLDFGEAGADDGQEIDSSWAPKGLDGFISEARCRRKVSGPEAPKPSKPARQRTATDLLRASEVADEPDKTHSESEEEDFAPIAVVPQLGAASNLEEEAEDE